MTRNTDRERDRRAALFEHATDPIAEIVFEAGTPVIADVNAAFENTFEFDRETVAGRSVSETIVPESGRSRHEELGNRVAAGESIDTTVERVTASGTREFRLRIVPVDVDDEAGGAYAWYTDVTERARYEADLKRLNDASRRLLTATTEAAVGDIVLGVVQELVEGAVGAMWTYDPETDALVPVGRTGEDGSDSGSEQGRTAPDAGIELVDPTSREMAVFEGGTTTELSDYQRLADPALSDDGIRSALLLPLGEHGQLLVGTPSSEPLDRTTRELLETLCRNTEAALEHVRRERTLSQLNSVTQNLVAASSPAEVGEIAVEAGKDILGLPFTHVYLTDDAGETLRPVAVSDAMADRFGELPTFERGDGVFWDVLGTEETYLYDDAQSEAALASDMPFRGAVIAPLGDRGVFASGSLEPTEFDTFDRKIASILASTVDVALDRVERERRLREHERELERQNQRLEKFASAVSHDLRNPLNVATGWAERADAERETDRLDPVLSALDRMDEMIDDLLTLTQAGDTIKETESVDLASVVAGCWRNVDTERAELDAAAGMTVRADESRLRHVFENLFRNAVEHSAGPVTIGVGELADETGFYVEDDGPGIPPDERESVFEHGYSTSDDGTGFGLSIVREIVEAHGWSIAVTESASGGARFEVTGLNAPLSET